MASMLKELKMHSLSDIVSMGFSFIATKLFYPGATLVRRPFHIRQKSNLRFEPGFTTGHGCRFEMFDEGVIELGRNCRIGDNVHLAALHKITIGDLRIEDIHLRFEPWLLWEGGLRSADSPERSSPRGIAGYYRR